MHTIVKQPLLLAIATNSSLYIYICIIYSIRRELGTTEILVHICSHKPTYRHISMKSQSCSVIDGQRTHCLVSRIGVYSAGPISRALDLGADIVVTGRCVDSALVLAPLVHKVNIEHLYQKLYAKLLSILSCLLYCFQMQLQFWFNS